MTSTTIAEQVGDMNAKLAAQPPNKVMGVFAREQSELAARGRPRGVIPIGATLPDVDLLDAHGAPTTLYTVTGGRPAVVVFYRGAWCPYCNIMLAHYQAHLLPALAERGVGLIAVSPQTPDGSLTMQQKHDLTFAVVSDPSNTLTRYIGILSVPSAEARAAQLQLGLDLTAVNADSTTTIPMPTTLILDRGHIVRWLDVHPDYSTRSEVDEILAALHNGPFQPVMGT